MIRLQLLITKIFTSHSEILKMTMKKSGAQGRQTYQIFDAVSYAINGLTKNEVLELKDAFDLLDPQFTGKIDANCTC